MSPSLDDVRKYHQVASAASRHDAPLRLRAAQARENALEIVAGRDSEYREVDDTEDGIHKRENGNPDDIVITTPVACRGTRRGIQGP